MIKQTKELLEGEGVPVLPKGVIVCFPAYNEEKYIYTLVLKARKYADEVIVVDDGSKDKTAEVARLAGATVVQHEHNKGYGESIKTILNEAKKRSGHVVVILDADYQHSPDEIPRLINAVLEGYDLVIGSREQEKRKIPRYRRLGQNVLGLFSWILSGKKVDSESGFRALSSRAVAQLELRHSGFAIDTEMLAVAVEKNLRITEVPISVTYTEDGSTLNPLVHGVGNLLSIITMILERKPLVFFGTFGLILLTSGLIILSIATISATASIAGIQTADAMVGLVLVAAGSASIFTGIGLNLLIRRKKNGK